MKEKNHRADAIVDFVRTYQGGLLSFYKVEKMAGIAQGTLSHYVAKKKKDCYIGPHRLSCLEKALKKFGYKPPIIIHSK